MQTEILFVVEPAPEGGWTARAHGQSIHIQAESVEALRQDVRDAVDCHFEPADKPQLIRLHFVHDEVLAA